VLLNGVNAHATVAAKEWSDENNGTDSRSGGGPKETHLSLPTGVKDDCTFNYGVLQAAGLVMFGL